MLPRKLSDDLCSLRPNERRPALVCIALIKEDGRIDDNIEFFSAWVESKSKLVMTKSLIGLKIQAVGSQQMTLTNNKFCCLKKWQIGVYYGAKTMQVQRSP